MIPYLTRSGATGEPPRRLRRTPTAGVSAAWPSSAASRRARGWRPFVAGLNALEPELLEGIELEFFGKATPAWPPERVDALLSEKAKRALRDVVVRDDARPARGAREAEPARHAGRHSLLGTTRPTPSTSASSAASPSSRATWAGSRSSSPGGSDPCPLRADGRGRCRRLYGVRSRTGRPAAGASRFRRRRLAASAGRRSCDAAACRRAVESARRVDVVVVHRASRAALERCLSALAGQSYQGCA